MTSASSATCTIPALDHSPWKIPIRLGARQYFVLGDNSPSSDDSRFWADLAGRPLLVPEANFLGKPFLVHLPGRIINASTGWASPMVDWGRIRWLH